MVMDTSKAAVLVNGELLSRYVGKRVRCVLKLIKADAGVLQALTSDGQQVQVQVQTQMSAMAAVAQSQFVEVIGIADNDRTIIADICTSFGNKFDMSAYNQLCQLANTEYQDLFI